MIRKKQIDENKPKTMMEQIKKIESGVVDVWISRPLTQQELEFEFFKRNKKFEELIEQND